MVNTFKRIKREFGSFIRQYKRKSHKSFDQTIVVMIGK